MTVKEGLQEDSEYIDASTCWHFGVLLLSVHY